MVYQSYEIYVILNVPSRAHTWHLYVLALPLEDFWDIHRQLMTCELESLDLTLKKRIVMLMCFLIKTLLFVCHDKNNIVYFIVHNSYCCLLWCFLGHGTVLCRPLGLGDTNPTLVSLTCFLQTGILCLGLIILLCIMPVIHCAQLTLLWCFLGQGTVLCYL